MSDIILPKSWIQIELKDITFKITDGSHNPPSKKDDGMPMLSAINVMNNLILFDNYRLISKKEFEEEYKRANVEENDILLTIVGTIGRSAVVPPGLPQFTLQRSVALIKPILINQKWLNFYLQSRVCQNYFIHEEKGTAQKGVYLGSLKKLPVNLPPLPEQHRIVTKIEELFSSLDKGIESLKTAQAQLKIYRQAVLKWAFEGKLTEEWRRIKQNLPTADRIIEQIKIERIKYCQEKKIKSKTIFNFNNIEINELPEISVGWKWVKIDALVEHSKHAIKAGPFGSSLKKEFYVQNGFKIYGQEQVISGDAFLGDYYIPNKKYNELLSCKVKAFDILISLVGTIGKVLILPENALPGIINPRLVKISINSSYYRARFFKYYFESSFLKAIYKQQAHGATMDVLNLGIIEKLPFPLCSMDEQQQIILEIESRLSVCDKLEESITQSLLQSEALRQSILKKAFEGKLVPQDQNDESASVLLERIRVERAAVIAKNAATETMKPGRKTRTH